MAKKVKVWKGGQRTLDEIATLTLPLNDEPADTPPLDDAAPPPAQDTAVTPLIGQMSLPKKVLVGLATAVAIISVLWFPLALGLMAGFPFALWMDEPKLEPVGARATFEESVDCLIQYPAERLPLEGFYGLDSKMVAFCFPPQTAAKKKALIACFNRYERIVRSSDWPKENMRACRWDGLPAVSTPFAFGKVEAVPAVPRAGKRFVLKVGMTSGGSAFRLRTTAPPPPLVGGAHPEQPWDIFEAVSVEVWIDDDKQVYEPLNDWDWEVPADGKLHVSFMVPKRAAGTRLTIQVFLKPDAPGSTKLVAYTVRR
jgi:hypothetical protein